MSKRVEISADWLKLMEDGAGTAKYYLSQAIETIDKEFGEGYSKKHPELIGAFMNTAAKDNHATILGKCILSLRDSLSEDVGFITNSIYNLSDATRDL